VGKGHWGATLVYIGFATGQQKQRPILGSNEVRHIAAAISQLKAHPIVRVCCGYQKSPFYGHISLQLVETTQSLVVHNELKQLQTLRNVVAFVYFPLEFSVKSLTDFS